MHFEPVWRMTSLTMAWACALEGILMVISVLCVYEQWASKGSIARLLFHTTSNQIHGTEEYILRS